MNWDAIGAIAEVVGAVGVIASLIYLGLQMREANRAAAVAAKLEAATLLGAFMDVQLQNPELDALWRRGRESIDGLDADEYYRFSNFVLKAFWFFSAGHFQLCCGRLAQSDWAEIRAIIRYWLDGAGCRAWWAKTGQFNFGERFKTFVNEEITLAERRRATGGRRTDD